MTDAQQKEWDLKLRKIDAEIANLNALTAKIVTENRWYPAVVGAGFMAAAVTIAKLFF
ncbi:hypothetical protein [Ruegeria sp. HKCCD8929]|uniref:hypothetical protein n=1 Tax=Ruegeria sp. HKCCD8929 TaxID=2683006 RepID=UPI001C2B8919|nr:hypothetical protein [Ruegeria sp. HKCCD8929]